MVSGFYIFKEHYIMAEIATEEAVEMAVETEPQKQDEGKMPSAMQAELELMRKALKDANNQAAAERIKRETLERAEQARKDAELSEVDRLKKEAETLRATAEAATRAVLQRDIAAEVGLPAPFAARIVGADREAMLADAKALLDAMPKPGAPQMSATNPGGAAAVTETDAQKRKRLGLA
jgi:hypothetical protein